MVETRETGSKYPIGPLSPPPSAYTGAAVLSHAGGTAELRCTYERNGSMYSGGLSFDGVRALRYRTEGHATSWHVEGAYDLLVEVKPSVWVAELRADGEHPPWDRPIRHFLIYVDDHGAYEVAAADCTWLPEERVLGA